MGRWVGEGGGWSGCVVALVSGVGAVVGWEWSGVEWRNGVWVGEGETLFGSRASAVVSICCGREERGGVGEKYFVKHAKALL